MQADVEQIAALVEKICSSPPFTGAPERTALLRYLFGIWREFKTGKGKPEIKTTKEIAVEHLNIDLKDPKQNPDRPRERCSDLREALAAYQNAPDAIWRCSLPSGVRGQGYKLVFTRIEREDAATRLFWGPHLERPEHVMVVCNSHLFFYDPELDYMLRFHDVNGESDDNEDGLAALKDRRPKAYKANLRANYFYFSAGEVNAHEQLQKWFHERTHLLVPRYQSREVLDRQIHNSSPILLGRPGANRFIRRILDSPEAAHLAYRFRPPLGAVHITKPNKDELQVLSRFPLTKSGILGPVPKWQEIFGIVTRLPNPSGQGAVTIIAADYYPRVIMQIAATLTSSQRMASALAKLGRAPDGTLPSSFEMLFAVKSSPGNLEGEGHAELLCARPPARGW